MSSNLSSLGLTLMLLDGVLPKARDVASRESNARITPLLDIKLTRGYNLACAPIAQRTRAPVFGTGGRGFKSL